MTRKSSPASGRAGTTRVVFLGGAGEIGRNMTIFEHSNEILILDCGLMFPTEEMLGVDLVLPDFEYLRRRASKVRGVLLTHGHEDHIGGVPYLLKELPDIDVYGTRLTLGLLQPKLEEHGVAARARLSEFEAPGRLSAGPFEMRFLPVCHSIPDGVATVLETPGGRVLHTGDFRIDPTPIDGKVTDLKGFADAGRAGVDLMLSDSTNADKPGSRISETEAGVGIADAVAAASGRVIVACFASNIHRIQQTVWAAEKAGRKVAFLGRSMHNNVEVARRLGYLDVSDDVVVPIERAADNESSELVVISTGSQGEPLSALSRMASRDHKWIELERGDTVILSATPIPGNESAVSRVINSLHRLGVEVVHPPAAQVHVSGHAPAADLAEVIGLVKPRFLVPVHGEYRHLALHAKLAKAGGAKPVIVEDGDVLELSGGEVRRGERVHAGYVFVDGLGIGDVRDVVIRDRRLLAEDGIIVAVVTVEAQTGRLLAGPDLISRGFVHEDGAGDFFDDAASEIRRSLGFLAQDEISDWTVVRRHVRRALGAFVWERTQRRPVILPVVMEV